MSHHGAREAAIRLAFVIIACALPVFVTGCISRESLKTRTLPPTTDTDRLHARYFGASTLLLADKSGAILIDGFFSRPLLTGLFTGFKSKDSCIDEGLALAQVECIDAVLVAHSHHDHALDAAKVARRKRAALYGSHATIGIAKRDGFDDATLLYDGKEIKHGGFKITVIETPHAEAPPLMRWLEERKCLPGVRDYPFDNNFAFYIEHDDANILIMPSAALPPKGFRDHVKPDIVFLSIAYLDRQTPKDIKRYRQQTVVDTCAKVVVPIHWDNLMGAVGKPLKPIPLIADNVPRALDALKGHAAGTDVRFGLMPPPAMAVAMTRDSYPDLSARK